MSRSVTAMTVWMTRSLGAPGAAGVGGRAGRSVRTGMTYDGRARGDRARPSSWEIG
ncbi:hypothetical protein [Actinomycetospora sp. TBRC 11914]|uniref:hypothetical protein n=1 Tax=Actinomycetospora sp. TBRC 11914 TaxID=2729387 RepID=UPI00145D173D|nr:hypothetical protein [Actinomycetospora sp. TBRC 11914]NMO89532.1 hypothetical protein [Actinomycetospora sp. TBRC 11914]